MPDKIIAVTGATGTQGGGLGRAILAHPEQLLALVEAALSADGLGENPRHRREPRQLADLP